MKKEWEKINKEIDDHKWIESEKAGKDLNRWAIRDWLINQFGEYVKHNPLDQRIRD